MKLLHSSIRILLATVLLTGCVGIRYLKKDQYLIYQQKIKGNKETSSEDLADLYKIKPNKRIPLIQLSPYIYLYQWGLKSYHEDKLESKRDSVSNEFDRKLAQASGNQKLTNKLTKKRNKSVERIDKTIHDGNFLMRLGEPLAVYDSSAVKATQQQMQVYLFNKGFFNSSVNVDLSKEDRLMFITFNVHEGKPNIIDSVIYVTGNPQMDSLIDATGNQSFVKVGDHYDQDNLVKERERLEELFKDNGYYDFSREYISCTADTGLLGNNRTVIQLTVQKSDPAEEYKVYRIDSVIFTTDVTNSPVGYKRFSETYQGITFRYIRDSYSKKILDRRVFIYPGQFYSQKNTVETQRQLLNLDNFKFVNINYDTTGGTFIANIFTSPLKKYQETNEVGMEVTQGFPGPFYNLSLKVRNVFHGLENLEISGRIGYEGVASAANPTQVYSSTEAGGQLNLTFPQFILPINDTQLSKLGKFNPKTSLTAGYSYIKRPEYRRDNFNSKIFYSWQRDLRQFFNASFADISLIKSRLDDEFQQQLDTLKSEGSNLWRTFEPSLVLSTSFSVTNNYNQYGTAQSRTAAFWKNYIELGGSVLNLFKVNYLNPSGLELYKYVKINTDYRRYISLTPKTQFAFRGNFGIAKSYAANGVLPYEKYFFAGGSNSNRAWRPRRLGPGSYFPSDQSGTRFSDRYEQPGELLLESSAELRTHIVKFIQGAVFADAGNVWMLEKDKQRPGAEFNIDTFYQQIAVGAGLGVRFDFTFLLLRFDLGFKIYNPALPEGLRFIGDQIAAKNSGVQEKDGINLESLPPLGIFNLGIGYPF